MRCNASNARHKHLTSTHSARSNALALRGRSTRGLGAAPPTRGETAARLTALSTVHWAGLGWCTRWARLAKRRRGAQLSSGGGGPPRPPPHSTPGRQSRQATRAASGPPSDPEDETRSRMAPSLPSLAPAVRWRPPPDLASQPVVGIGTGRPHAAREMPSPADASAQPRRRHPEPSK